MSVREELEKAVKNMEETLAICDEAAKLGYLGASKEIVDATRRLTRRQLAKYRKALQAFEE